jgi:hypothetical protein
MDEREYVDEEDPQPQKEEAEEEDFPLQVEDSPKVRVRSQLVLVRGPLFDFCSASITIVISFAVVINYLVISDRVKLKDLPYGSKHEEAIYAVDHQRLFTFPNAEISSLFDSGNARAITQNSPYEFEVKVGGERQAKARRWFYFTVDNVQQPVTMMFFISNLTLDRDMLQQGVVPVFKSDSSAGLWAKLEYITRLRQIDTNEMEIEFSYQYDPAADGKIAFALCYPWSYLKNQKFYRELLKIYSSNPTLFFEKHLLSKTAENSKVDVLFLSSTKNLDKQNRTSLANLKFPTLQGDKQIFILAARLHGYESISSIAIRHAVKFLLSETKEAKALRDKFLFLIIPMLNPDSVKLGLNLVDSGGLDLEHSYEEAHPLKHLIAALNAKPNYKGLLLFRASLDSDFVKFRVPGHNETEVLRHLDLAANLAQFSPNVKLESLANLSTSPLLHHLANTSNSSLVVEANIPTMRKTKAAKTQVIATDIETVVNGDSAAQGGLGLRQTTKKVMIALTRTLLPKKSDSAQIKKTRQELLSKLLQNLSKPK